MSDKKVNVIVDNRERDLLRHLINFKPEVKALDIGDVLYYYDGVPRLVIERKTVADLSASIKDGRHREQKARLIDCYRNKGVMVMYMIEGYRCDGKKKKGIADNVFIGSFSNSIIRDKIYVYHTSGVGESAKMITAFVQKLEKFGGMQEGGEVDYISQLKHKKKENKDVQDGLVYMLCQVPGVSAGIARPIRDKFKNVSRMCKKLRKQDDECVKYLAEVKVNEKRKLGKVLAKRICEWLGVQK